MPALARDGAAGRGRRTCVVDRGRGGALADGSASLDAAIAAPIAADHYRLGRWPRDVADNAGAVTRFVMVSRPGEPPLPTGADKTSLVAFISDDHPGALLEVLTEFAVRGVNLTRIESRPTGEGIGRYCFSIDARGTSPTRGSARRSSGLRRVCPDVRFLGSYPRADRGAAAEAAAEDAAEKDVVFRDASAWLGRSATAGSDPAPLGEASQRAASTGSRSASGSPRSGSRTPGRTASSCAQNAMPRNSAIEVRYAHSSSAVTPVNGP